MKTCARPRLRAPPPPRRRPTDPACAPRRFREAERPARRPDATGRPRPAAAASLPQGRTPRPPSRRLPTRTPPRRVPEAGADDRTRTGDLVLTKDALYLLSYIGIGIGIGAPPPARGAAPRRTDTPLRPRRTADGADPPRTPPGAQELERETGIEPATNSLEGCDSTTELLPRPRLLPSRPAPPGGRTMLVARGGFEPPKPLGRQIYSLLRLTAPQPRPVPRRSGPGAAARAQGRRGGRTPIPGHPGNGRRTDAETHLSRGSNPLELAKGFEPPTR